MSTVLLPPTITTTTTVNNPFHDGEIRMQQILHRHDHVMSYAPKVIRSYMPEQHREFYQQLPFVVLAIRDDEGHMWSSLLPTKTHSPDPEHLIFGNDFVLYDAVYGILQPGMDIGILGIEFATKRRNRVNGHIVSINDQEWIFQVDQSFGNCPQYIKPRKQQQTEQGQWVTTTSSAHTTTSHNRITTKQLNEEQMQRIRVAETLFIASGYHPNADDDPNNTKPYYGNDASHRGGPPGFVMIRDHTTLLLPDYSGNNHFNTIGNILMDPRIGITIPQFDTGGMIQITGWAELMENNDHMATLIDDHTWKTYFRNTNQQQIERWIQIHIEYINEIPDYSFPIRYTSDDEIYQIPMIVSSKIRESDDVMSFHFQPNQLTNENIWKSRPGQHLGIRIPSLPERTYTNSSTSPHQYRISVKRQGQVSNYLHDHIQVGDIIDVYKPSGDFILQIDNDHDDDIPIVLFSSGIGITPMISMLHYWYQWVAKQYRYHRSSSRHFTLYWIHGATDRHHHPFRDEVQQVQHDMEQLELDSNDKKIHFIRHIAYSKPCDDDDDDQGYYDSVGRLTIDKIRTNIITDHDHFMKAHYYMCGTNAFVTSMEEGLTSHDIPTKQIHYETFGV